MSALAFNRREKRSERIYFIPAGTTVDSVVVAIATWPDNAPLTNYTDFQFNDIETSKPERKTSQETFMIPGTNGGYDEDEEDQIVNNSWIAETHKTNALVRQIEMGLLTIPVAGTAQIPFARKQNYLDGVLLKETQIESTGAITDRLQVWARMSIMEAGEAGPKTALVKVKFQRLASGNNTYLPIA